MKNVKMKTRLVLGFGAPICLTALNLIISVMALRGAAAANHTPSYVTSASIFIGSLAAASIVVMILVAMSIIRALEKNVDQLYESAKKIAMGRVDVNMTRYRNDEFGLLVDEYSKVIENIKYQAKIAEEVSQGNLTVNVVPRSGEDVLGYSLKKLVDDNFRVMTNITDVGSQVTISSSQVASASQALAQGSTEQASAIQQITASIDEIAEKTKKNAEQANEASGLVVNAIHDVKEGNEQMKQMLNAMQEINKASEGISKVIKVISDIAFQTNILALNAAVEAARAGAAGKGFAVVSNEVRTLAGESDRAAKATRELIENSIAASEKGRRIVDEVSGTLQTTLDLVVRSSSDIGGIAEAVQHEAVSIAQVTEGISQISAVVQSNSASSEESAAVSSELFEQVRLLQEQTRRFRLKS